MKIAIKNGALTQHAIDYAFYIQKKNVIAQRNFHCLLSYQINRAYVALLKG
jgi:hypothetical protein